MMSFATLQVLLGWKWIWFSTYPFCFNIYTSVLYIIHLGAIVLDWHAMSNFHDEQPKRVGKLQPLDTVLCEIWHEEMSYSWGRNQGLDFQMKDISKWHVSRLELVPCFQQNSHHLQFPNEEEGLVVQLLSKHKNTKRGCTLRKNTTSFALINFTGITQNRLAVKTQNFMWLLLLQNHQITLVNSPRVHCRIHWTGPRLK